MLTVDIAGFGIVQTNSSAYSVYIIGVQEPMESWTVYRTLPQFKTLFCHLQTIIHRMPSFPPITETLIPEILHQHVPQIEQWLQSVIQKKMKDSSIVYDFLCSDANSPPAHIDITWTGSYKPSLDEMEMDELFDRHLEQNEEDIGKCYDEDDSEEDISCFHEEGELITSFGGYSFPMGLTNNLNEMGEDKSIQSDELDEGEEDDDDDDDDDDDEEEDNKIFQNSFIESSINDKLFVPSIPTDQDKKYQTNHIVKQRTKKSLTHHHQQKQKISLDRFSILKVIGKGSFGKVFLVRDQVTQQIFAMKVLRKDYVIGRNQVEHTKTERSVLGYVRHPFIVGLNMAFQTKEKLYFVLDYCPGGELFFHLGKVGKFPEPRAKFYAAEITIALAHMHKYNIIYRDLKPENVLLDHQGHIRLTDFGLSKEGVSQIASGAHSFCGTPEYLAPEILNRQGHGRAVDWWSLGALLYEMLTGLPPFYSRDRQKLFEKIRKADLSYPRYLSENAKSFLQGLLTKDPNKRLGSGQEDALEIKRHSFFSDIDWIKLEHGEIASPWQPSVVGSLDTSQFDNEFTSMPIASPDTKTDVVIPGSLDKLFEGFTYTNEIVVHQFISGTSPFLDDL